MTRPLFMIAGGSGVVPIRAMLRPRKAKGIDTPAYLLYSARSASEVIYREELDDLAGSDGFRLSLALTK